MRLLKLFKDGDLIKTDHKSLKELMSQVIQTQEQQFYLTKLLGFQYEILYRPGKCNQVADALSRQEEFLIHCNVLSVIQNPIFAAIREANNSDVEMQNKHLQFTQGNLPAAYTVKDEMLFLNDRILVPDNPELKKSIFHTYHELPISGHGGIQKTYKAIAEIFVWNNMLKEIKEFIKGCRVCQQVKSIARNLKAYYNLYLLQLDHGRT